MNEYYTVWINGEWTGEDYPTLEEAQAALPALLIEAHCSQVGDSASVVIAKCQDICVGEVSIKLNTNWVQQDKD